MYLKAREILFAKLQGSSLAAVSERREDSGRSDRTLIDPEIQTTLKREHFGVLFLKFVDRWENSA